MTMKDIVITSERIRKEIYYICGSFVLSFATNIFAVIAYSRPWTELFSQLGYVAVIAVAVYSVLLVLRIVVWIFVKIF